MCCRSPQLQLCPLHRKATHFSKHLHLDTSADVVYLLWILFSHCKIPCFIHPHCQVDRASTPDFITNLFDFRLVATAFARIQTQFCRGLQWKVVQMQSWRFTLSVLVHDARVHVRYRRSLPQKNYESHKNGTWQGKTVVGSKVVGGKTRQRHDCKWNVAEEEKCEAVPALMKRVAPWLSCSKQDNASKSYEKSCV